MEVKLDVKLKACPFCKSRNVSLDGEPLPIIGGLLYWTICKECGGQWSGVKKYGGDQNVS